MADILHRVSMNAAPAEVFRALTADASRWWTGEQVKLRVIEIVEGPRDARVAWRCVDGPPAWVGTEVTFDLATEASGTCVHLAHRKWRDDAADAIALCTTKWARFLFSVKSWVETPEPDDLC
ncbi:MAG: hypothetical protein KF819_35575 [Labilithrix sp.]|nr:hypothetical protein [Labilithrix sp.]